MCLSKFVKLSVIILNIIVITSTANHHWEYKLKKEILEGGGEIISVTGNSTECKAKGRESYKCS